MTDPISNPPADDAGLTVVAFRGMSGDTCRGLFHDAGTAKHHSGWNSVAEPLVRLSDAASMIAGLVEALTKIASGYAGCDDFQDAQAIADAALSASAGGE